MLPVTLLRRLPRFLPKRVLNRPSMQVLLAGLDVDARQVQTRIGPEIPIGGEIRLTNSYWRRDVTLMLWALMREAMAAEDRLAWLMCVGFPRDEPIDDLYALGVQAESVVQLHIFREQADLDLFNERFVPPASLEEGRRRRAPEVCEALAEIALHPGTFTRVTASLSMAHTLVKQWSSGQLAIAVDISQPYAAIETLRQASSTNAQICFFLTGDPLQARQEIPDAADVVVVRRLGLSFLDELALIKVCDAYVGVCDHSAIFAADAGIPCLLESDVDSDYGGRVRCASDPTAEAALWLESIKRRAMFRVD
jgi:hypothetical protein